MNKLLFLLLLPIVLIGFIPAVDAFSVTPTVTGFYDKTNIEILTTMDAFEVVPSSMSWEIIYPDTTVASTGSFSWKGEDGSVKSYNSIKYQEFDRDGYYTIIITINGR